MTDEESTVIISESNDASSSVSTLEYDTHRNLIFFKKVSALESFQLWVPDVAQQFSYKFNATTSKERKVTRIDISTFLSTAPSTSRFKKQFYFPLPIGVTLELVENETYSYVKFEIPMDETVAKDQFYDLMQGFEKIFADAVEFTRKAYNGKYEVDIWEYRSPAMTLSLPSKVSGKWLVSRLNEEKNFFKMISLKYFRMKIEEGKGKISLSPVFELYEKPFEFALVKGIKRKAEEVEKPPVVEVVE